MYDMIPELTSLISSFFEMLKAWSKGPATKRGLLARQFLENRHTKFSTNVYFFLRVYYFIK